MVIGTSTVPSSTADAAPAELAPAAGAAEPVVSANFQTLSVLVPLGVWGVMAALTSTVPSMAESVHPPPPQLTPWT